jgi:hypothetical protein
VGVHDALVTLEWKENIVTEPGDANQVNIMEPHLSKATRVPQLTITNTTLYTLATLAAGLRLYTRSRIIRNMIAGDWWMLGAWVCAFLSSLDQKFCKFTNRHGSSVNRWFVPLNLPFGVTLSVNA